MTVAVRLSRDADAALILDVVEDAFNSPEHDAKEEIDIVRSTWTACQPPRLLELVAHDGRNLVGHVMAAPGMLGWAPGPHSHEALGVAPLSVAPERQGEGPQLTFRAIEGMEPPPLELAGAGADTE